MNTVLILESRLKYALERTRSISEAARYLNYSRNTIYKYMKLYGIPYENYSNKPGLGIIKGRIASKYKLRDILEGKHNGIKFDKSKLIVRLIRDLFFEEKCEVCGLDEKRIIDEKVPLLIDNINADRSDWRQENLRFLCYNCYFYNVGNVFGQKNEKTAIVDPFTGNIIEKITL